MPEIPLIHAILGGLLIGLGLGALMLFNGRIGGIQGAVSSIVARDLGPDRWKLFYVVGIIVGGVAVSMVVPSHFSVSAYDRPFAALVVSGLIVGFGGRLCNGCTSGHGLCGIARLSKRSIVATGTFFGMALLSTYVLRHVVGVL